ncbi:hypothetical protein JHK87_004246 [Glycine soja]|nr:hypothetical protein JHK87_004246 [Glycine soja]
MVETMVDTDPYSDMVTTLTSTVDDDEAPSTVDGGVALHGNLLNAPRNLFTASSSSRQQWWLKKKKNLSRQWNTPPLGMMTKRLRSVLATGMM